MCYVEGFVLAVPKKNLKAYFAMARKTARVWRDHGALEVREAVGDDPATSIGVPFPRLAKARKDEAVVFAWIVYASRAQRDRLYAKVVKDPRFSKLRYPREMLYDVKRASFGGFELRVNA